MDVQLDYDGQRKRTRVKPKDLDPVWNEKVWRTEMVLSATDLRSLLSGYEFCDVKKIQCCKDGINSSLSECTDCLSPYIS